MEHRYHPRLKTYLNVGVFRNEDFLGNFETRDISREGIGLRAERANLRLNDVIDLQISIDGETHHQKGLVVHASGHGVGVMLIETNYLIVNRIFDEVRDQGSDLPSASGATAGRAPESPGSSARLNPAESQVEHSFPSMAERAGSAQSQQYALPKGLMIRIGKRLDISVTRLIKRAAVSIRSDSPKMIVIDLTETKVLYDSGVALLMFLAEEAGELSDRIYLINTDSKIVDRLNNSPVAGLLHIV